MDFRKYASDKVKEARSTGSAWMTYARARLRIVPIDPYNEESGTFIFKHRGKVYVEVLGRRKGSGPLQDGRGRFVHERFVMAKVVEVHRPPGPPTHSL